jgi:hypothetical protein
MLVVMGDVTTLVVELDFEVAVVTIVGIVTDVVELGGRLVELCVFPPG